MNATLIRGGCLYPADEDHSVVPDGAVLVVGSDIVAAGPTETVEAGVDPRTRCDLKVIDARGHMILPGFVNSHWHEMFALRLPFKGALRPAPDRDDRPAFMALGGDVQQVSVVFDSFCDQLDRLSRDDAYAVARYSMWTQLRSGVTTLADVGSFNHPDAMVAAARDLGLRCMLSTWASDAVCAPGEGRARRTRDTDEVLGRVEALLRHARREGGEFFRARPAAVYATNMTDELCRGMALLTEDYGVPFATHVGALRNEPGVMAAYHGQSGVRRLAEHGLLTDKCMAVHCAFADCEEQGLMAAAHVHVSHSPAKYGQAGEASLTETRTIPQLRRRGLGVSLSTDGAALPLGGMVENMRAAWQAYNEMFADPTELRPTDALAMATRIPATGLWWDEVGSLEVGKKADLVLVRTDDWRYLLNPRPLEGLVALGSSMDIDTVMVGGQLVVRRGHPTMVDEAVLEAEYLQALRSFSVRGLGLNPDLVDQVVGRPSRRVA